MNIIKCILKNPTLIESKEYYKVQEEYTKEVHNIPVNQIEIFDDLESNKTYDFIKEFNPINNKTYLSIIPPKYIIGNEIEFDIKEIKYVDDRIFFELKSEYLFPLSVRSLPWQKDLDTVKCKIVGYKRGKPVLKNIDLRNNEWIIGETKSFKINGYGKISDRRGIERDGFIIKIKGGYEIKVKTGQWHKPDLWKFDDIKCKIIGLTKNGFPKLVINDKRHPLYNIGETYKFIVKGFEDKVLHSGTKIKVIKLIDKLGFNYEVMSLPNQENKLKTNQDIDCEVVDINSRLNLKQVNIDDPFYFKFEDVINDKSLKRKYFDNYLNDDDEFNLRLKSQYTQRSGFWVLTYCNHILTRIKSELSIRNDLTGVIDVLDLHSNFEEWILNKGILRAINNSDERKLTKRKIHNIIDNNKSEKHVINSILNFEENEFFVKQKEKVDFREIFYFIKHSNFSNIDEIKFLKFISCIKEIDSSNNHYIKRLINYIYKSLSIYKDYLYQDYFILSQNLKEDKKSSIIKYKNWLFIEISLTRFLDLNEETNLLISKFYRLNTYLISNYSINKKLLLNSFYIISNLDKKFEVPINPIEKKIDIDLDKLPENPNEGKTNIKTKKFYLSKITEKYYNGCKLYIDKTTGFLPYRNIYDSRLKNYDRQKIEWETNVEIVLYCDEFNYFTSKQLREESENFYSENLLKDRDPINGMVLIGKIKNITEYGIFVSTEYGDGLVHLSKISYTYFDKSDLPILFKVGEQIPVYVLDDYDNKLNLSLKDLIGTKYQKQYYDLIQFYDVDSLDEIRDDDNETNFIFKMELEKGFIFEQYAVIQNSIEEKIKYIKFSKVFFSNTKNARSYLLNIYIEYFNSLLKLDDLIKDYSFEKYNSFREDIIQIKEKVQLKTLENFPESKNLLFFIDILNLFNSQKEEDIEELFNLTKKSIEENDLLLKAVAKNALANNLIISEIDEVKKEELNNFTLKNLRRIREYISQGVLSVKETIEDKLTKELKEKRIYWSKMINQDEGEKLEFKSTLKTPVPSKEKVRIIKSLNTKLKRQKDPVTIDKIKNKIIQIKEGNKDVKNIEKIILHSTFKTICAFANTKGGTLLLGVSDDKNIFGLKQDYNSFKHGKDRDEFGKYFDEKLKDYFGDSFSSIILDKEFLEFPEGDILIVKVNQSVEEVFLLKNEKGEKEENIYVRNLSSSVKLKGIELSKFIKNRFRKLLLEKYE